MSVLRFIKLAVFICVAGFSIEACGNSGPTPIRYGNEQCAHCRMTISDMHFGCQLVTVKGRTYNFDDVQCMRSFVAEGGIAPGDIARVYLTDYLAGGGLRPAADFMLLRSETLRSPMQGNIAAFLTPEGLQEVQKHHAGEVLTWAGFWE